MFFGFFVIIISFFEDAAAMMLLEFLNSHGIQNNMRCFCGVVLTLQEHFFSLSQMQGDVSNMPLYSYVASM
jgi:hypothetical protein